MDDGERIYVQRWIAKAENDLRTARTMIAVDPPVTDTACFHCQQCVEKCLKACLVQANVHMEKTHFLRRLVAKCCEIDPIFDEFMPIADALTDYAVADRYPDNWREIPLDEAAEAYSMAERFMKFTNEWLERPLTETD